MKCLHKQVVTLLFAIVALSCGTVVQAQTLVFGAGLSTPSENINNVYNVDRLRSELNSEEFADVVRETAKLGYHGLLKYYFEPMEAGTIFYMGAGYHRFPISDITVYHPQDSSLRADLTSTQNIVPLFAGFEYPILRTVLGVYIAADLQYTINFNSIDVVSNQLPLDFPISTSTSYNRVGASVGAGFDINAIITNVGVDVRYNISNLFGREDLEEEKSYLSLSLCVSLGTKERPESEDDDEDDDRDERRSRRDD